MGRDKALLRFNAETLLERTVRVLSRVVDPVVVVGRVTLPLALHGTQAIPDIYQHAGPLGGIATGLRHIQRDRAVVVSCDLPYLEADLIELLVGFADEWDAIVPLWDGRLQGTCALYSSLCLPVAASMLEKRQYRLRDLFDRIHARTLLPEELEAAGIGAQSVRNVNTPDEWVQVVDDVQLK